VLGRHRSRRAVHAVAASRTKELYVVLDGHVTFEIDGETFDAPAGTLLAVAPESKRKATGEGTVLAIAAKPG
jgi:mannose-6-phosphate isomerase-like protein (cupin superfamily)